jgi:hypothetical protein
MAVITNQKNSFDSNANADIDARAINETGVLEGAKTQVVTWGFAIRDYDYIGVTYPSGTQEVYTFKTGGVSGTILAVITVDYTDSTKESISSVAKS